MKTIVVIWCVFAMSAALSLIIPENRDYLTNIEYVNEQPVPKIIDLMSDEEQLLSKRVGRQYYNNQGLPTQSKCFYSFVIFICIINTNYENNFKDYDYNGYNANGYNSYVPNYPNYNRRNYQSQRRRRFGGIGSAIIV